MAMYNNQYAQKIYEIISPVVGELMAKGALKSQCNRIGITEEGIKNSDLNPLAENFQKGLIIFLGSDGASQIAAKIKML
jgi:hypothetical protein